MSKKNEFLNEEKSGADRARGLLARLFRLILWENNFNGIKWAQHMERLLDDPRRGLSRHTKERGILKGNLNKELRDDRMTWNVFFGKALPFLNPLKVRFIVQITWRNHRVTNHSIELLMDGAAADEMEEGESSPETPPAPTDTP